MNDAYRPRPPSGPDSLADNYVIGEAVALGGMGSVLEAWDKMLKRTVAIKTMSLNAAVDRTLRQRFVREAEVLAMLAHPNIVPIYDIVWEDGVALFYAMKLVKGRTLQAILEDLRDEEPLTPREFPLGRLLSIFRKVCDAIAFSHSKGVLHRDLKPENVMVGEFGEVLVMDWGLAKIIGEDSLPPSPDGGEARQGRTLAGAVIGTPQFMSPEQAAGRVDEIDERSDIYSLGSILYAILTLHPAVQGKTVQEILAKVTRGQIPSPAELPPRATGRVPVALASVAMKAMKLDKAERYQSILLLSAEIEAFQGGFATSSQQAGALRQTQLLMWRHKALALALALALAALLLLSVGFALKLIA